MKRTRENKKIITCPQCGYSFDISYGRAFACAGCASNVSCSYAKCPKCSHEFPISP